MAVRTPPFNCRQDRETNMPLAPLQRSTENQAHGQTWIGGLAMRLANSALAALSIVAAVITAAATPATPDQTLTGVAIAMSGDLLTVSGTSTRLLGIAAPAAGQTCKTRLGLSYDCYRRATEVLQVLISGGAVHCTVTTTDISGQRVGLCRAGDIDLAAAMVARGWAFAYRRLTPAYVGAESFAESHQLGMWAGRVETPWQWRSRHLSDTAK
jgi:endonuclease YncB( thermonuclease family)